MPRNMSFSMTTGPFRARTKTVTRRFGWWFLKPGDVVKVYSAATNQVAAKRRWS